ncbi:MAG TPA: hypothetical protein VHQ87_05965 [Rhizobacter sp.]|nr:hypothetical protein [Rhizobacter sp.]
MKYALVLTLAVSATAVSAQTSVGVSVSVAQPGVYGRIDIGNMPPPPVVYDRPVIHVMSPVVVQQQPIYLYVPPGHQKHWGKHCAKYNACGQPVYFVKESWVKERYDEEHGHGHGKGHGHDKGGKNGQH